MMRALREPMTIAQLKRHMDRRFDRLERVKANKSDLRQFATKRDLKRFATKVDLERFATKLDLEQYATKRDLERFATKDDLAGYVARAESLAADTRRYFDVVAESLRDEIRNVADVVAQVNHHSLVLGAHKARITALEHHS